MDTATKTATTKTGCEVVDQILAWTRPDGTLQVEKGDLILDDGELQQLASVTLIKEERASFVSYRIEGCSGAQFAGPAELVAVRRYAETVEG